ncbi:MAG TPA: leucyl/phenylalanyl-tRNA--protein transferase [Arachnia sp.]|nr:leucyl/phenylalanyl-tRNA--protein transferase [Arachnia sp.]
MEAGLFGRAEDWPRRDLIGYSEEFDAVVALAAYRQGVFPMPLDPRAMGWWSPMYRGVMRVPEIRVTRSLRKSANRYTTTVDAAFPRVLAACASPQRDGGWIDSRIRAAYTHLHEAGWVHSVEVWDEEGRLVGGLYGVPVGGLFAGQSMFHDPELGRDASKVALVRLMVELAGLGVTLLDVQWLTEHLGTLGAYEVTRDEYMRRSRVAVALPTAPWTRTGPVTGADIVAEHRLLAD